MKRSLLSLFIIKYNILLNICSK